LRRNHLIDKKMGTYVGIDIGKHRHFVAAIDGQGQVVLKPFVVTQAHAELEALDQRQRTLREPSQPRSPSRRRDTTERHFFPDKRCWH
jgi:predicted NBD/HSP70 family sugar kinase